jgi:hypothetical protein
VRLFLDVEGGHFASTFRTKQSPVTLRSYRLGMLSNRHDRPKASTTCRRSKLKSSTLDQHLDETLRRVRAEFERNGGIHPGFECMTDAESFGVPVNWPDHMAKGAACAALRDCFRRRGVNRYLFAGECWVGKTPGLRPADDPDRGESVQVLAVERNGLRRLPSPGSRAVEGRQRSGRGK